MCGDFDALRDERRRVLDVHVGADRDRLGTELLAVAQRVVGFAFEQALVARVDTGVHVDADEVESECRSNADRGARVVAQTVDTDEQAGLVLARARDAAHRSHDVRIETRASRAFGKRNRTEVLDEDRVAAASERVRVLERRVEDLTKTASVVLGVARKRAEMHDSDQACDAHAAIMPAMTELLDLAVAQNDEIVRLRRDFHKHPELSFKEVRTSKVIREYLEGLGLEVVQPEGMTGMWADLRVNGASKTLAFRADMDALAMDEVCSHSKVDFVSVHEGAAHCCGHDAHMAILLGAAKALTRDGARPKHNIRFLFQHAEEKAPGGAIQLIDAGCLEGVDEVYGLHVIPPIPSGRFMVLEGPFMAAADEMKMTIKGVGGHAAMPQFAVDPIVASAHVITALQQLVSRRTSPLATLVVSITTIQGGSGTTNVIPDQVELLGTVRTLAQDLWDKAPQWIEDCAQSAAKACGCSVELEYERGYPVLINDKAATAKARDAVATLFGDNGFTPYSEPLMASEDFARYGQQRPSCFVFLGVGNPEKGITASNHATDFDVDEDALHRGTAWFLQLARMD